MIAGNRRTPGKPSQATAGGRLAGLLVAALMIVPGPESGMAETTGFNGDGPINVTGEGVAVKGYDVVAYFTQNRPVKGSPKFEFEYKGATFRFASAKHREQFGAQPQKYTPAYGGYCALGVANGYKDDMHPAAYEIVNGRLYFNLSPKIQEYWSTHRRSYRLVERADANWSELRFARGYGPADAR